MLKITTGIGDLYLEDMRLREEDDRLKLYDSNKRYFDYFPLGDIDDECWLVILNGRIVSDLRNMSSINSLMSYLSIKHYKASDDWHVILKLIYGEDAFNPYDDYWIDLNDGSELTRNNVFFNDCVNQVGKTWIFIEE